MGTCERKNVARDRACDEKLKEVSPHRPNGRLRAVCDGQLLQNVLHVLFDGLVADSQALRYLFIREAQSKLLENFALTLG
jgi:hypothetical protein